MKGFVHLLKIINWATFFPSLTCVSFDITGTCHGGRRDTTVQADQELPGAPAGIGFDCTRGKKSSLSDEDLSFRNHLSDRHRWWRQSSKDCPRRSPWMCWAWSATNCLLHPPAGWVIFKLGPSVLTIPWLSWSTRPPGRTLHFGLHPTTAWVIDYCVATQNHQPGADDGLWSWIVEDLQLGHDENDSAGAESAPGLEVMMMGRLRNGDISWKIQFIHSLFRKQIQDVNWARKKDQTDAGDKIKQLEATWYGLVAKTYEIEVACCEIERQLASLNE